MDADYINMDTAEGFRMGYELEPDTDRMAALRELLLRHPSEVLRQVLELWDSGHGALPTACRIREFTKLGF